MGTRGALDFVAVWSNFVGWQGVVVSGCEFTQAELREFGPSWLADCFDPPKAPGCYRFKGAAETIEVGNPANGYEWDVSYEGEWIAEAPPWT